MLAITFLGTGAACPTVDRNVASLAVTREGETLLFDCGEGTQRQMMRYGVGFGLREIFFTHFHSDHMLGLTGLVRTMGLLHVVGQEDRQDGLTLYGPKGAQRVLSSALSVGIERTKFPVEIVELKPGDVRNRGEYDIIVFETNHGGWAETVGYALAEHTRLGRFHPERARELGIPEGPLWGRLHKGETITLPDGRRIGPEDLVGPSRAGRKLVISGDTRPHAALARVAAGADLLIHEATFGDDEAERAKETGHSTAREAAQLAHDAGVRRLALTHLSPRYTRDAPELLAQAQSIFPETVVARDGMVIEVGFADQD